MGMSPLDKAKTVMSGRTTAQQIDQAEQAAVTPRKIKPKKVTAKASAPVVKPQQKFVDARQREIDAAAARDRAAIIAMNKKMSLRSK